jgi:hypothetical protein
MYYPGELHQHVGRAAWLSGYPGTLFVTASGSDGRQSVRRLSGPGLRDLSVGLSADGVAHA